MKSIEVSAAIIHDAKGRIFATQRGYGEWKDYWEFPGGKIEPGESAEQALCREIREELDAGIVIEHHFQTVDFDYPQFQITLHCYLCRIIDNNVVLKEHEAAKWLETDELTTVKWLPADLQIIENLRTTIF